MILGAADQISMSLPPLPPENEAKTPKVAIFRSSFFMFSMHSERCFHSHEDYDIIHDITGLQRLI